MDSPAVVTNQEKLTAFLKKVTWRTQLVPGWDGQFAFPGYTHAWVTWREATAQSAPAKRQPGEPLEENAMLDFVANAAWTIGVNEGGLSQKQRRRVFAKSLLTPESKVEIDRLVLEAIEVLAVFQTHSE